MDLSNIAVLEIHGADYRCFISGISTSKAIFLMPNVDLIEKRGTYKI